MHLLMEGLEGGINRIGFKSMLVELKVLIMLLMRNM